MFGGRLGGRRRAGVCLAGAASVVVAVSLTIADTAAASGIKLCVPNKEGNAILTPKHGKCKKSYKLTGLGAAGKEGRAGAQGKAGAEGKTGAEGKAGPEGKAGSEGIAGLTGGELETLKSILPYIKYVSSGVGGRPTVRFSGVNVQILNGKAKPRQPTGRVTS